MRLRLGTRARVGAGLACATLLAAGAVIATRGADDDRARGDGDKVSFDTNGLPVATDAQGQPIDPSVSADPAADQAEVAGGSERYVELMKARAEQAASTPPPPVEAKPGAPDPTKPDAAPDSLLVGFEPDTTDADIDAALAAAGVTGDRIAETNTVVVDTTGADQAEASKKLEAADAVVKVEPNYVRSAAKLPNDPQVGAQRSYLDALGIQAAWDVANTGAGVTVAVLDTGADLDHPDLAPNLVAGYDFVNNDSSPQDDNGHGTETAGIIGAATNNGVGVAGVAWNAKIMPIKVLDQDGNGYDSDVAAGITWASTHGANVINLSLGGYGDSYDLEQAIIAAVDNGVVVVAAAGNYGSAAPVYPAAYSYDGVVAVAATDHAGQFAYFSSYGWWVSLAAPGINVRTTTLAPGAGAAYADGTGTSYSSPIVAGIAALLRERHPTWSSDRIGWELLRTAKDAGSAGVDASYGFGTVNAAAALSVAGSGTVSQPNLSGDASNVPASARAITPGTTATETIGYESDEDWFTFNVASPGGVTVTVTPPPADPSGLRARELDAILEIYGPGNGLVGFKDDGVAGEAETLKFNAAAGAHRVRISNYHGSAGPAAYTVQVQVGPRVPEISWAAPASALNTDANERATAVADVNGDGRDDLLATTGPTGTDANKVSMQLQEADGTLAAPVLRTAHGAVGGLAAGDFDGDSDIDVAVGVPTGVDVLWNDGAAPSEPTLVPTGATLRIIAADLDDAGATEMVVSNGSDLRVLSWSGSELTAVSLGFGTSNGIYDVGDHTGDGRPDIVTGSGRWVSIYAQTPEGGWSSPLQSDLYDVLLQTQMQSIRSLAIGDFSSDGRADIALVAGTNVPQSSAIIILRQQPDGLPGTPLAIWSASTSLALVEIGDVTADGRADVVAQQWGPGSDSDTVDVFRQTDAGLLSGAEVPVPAAAGPVPDAASMPRAKDGLAIGDIDGDNVDDIAVVSARSSGSRAGIVVVRHNKDAASTPEQPTPLVSSTAPAPHATAVATTTTVTVTFARDINPSTVTYGVDGTVLMWSARFNSWIDATVSLSGRTITIRPSQRLTPGMPYGFQLWGVEDTVGNPVYAAYGFTTVTAAPPTYNVNSTFAPFAADLTDDGFDDVVWYSPATGSDPIWVYTEHGKFDWNYLTLNGTFIPIAGDFDGNGFQDIYFYGPGAGSDFMTYWGLDSEGRWSIIRQVSIPVNGTYVPVAGDFDRNGYEDIFWYGPGSAGEALWSFRAGGAYTSKPMPPANATGYRLAAGDYNRDGYDDVFWHMPGTGGEALWKGGATGFTSTPATAVNGSYNLLAGDYTGDGFDDIYWYAGSAASIWRGGATTFTSQAAPAVAATARPVAGDFTGDGYDDLLAYVPGTTADRLLPGKTTGL